MNEAVKALRSELVLVKLQPAARLLQCARSWVAYILEKWLV